MRVAISLLTLAPGEHGGSEVYARELVRALSAVGTHEYVVVVPSGSSDAAAELPVVEVQTPRRARRGPARIGALLLSGRTEAGRAALERSDVVHYPLTVPAPRARVGRVVTLHDLQHRDLPERFSAPRSVFRRVAYDRAATRSEAVIVLSEFARRRALEKLGLDPRRVHVVPHGVDPATFRPGDEPREPFLLYPARPWAHKNHTRLFDAFRQLRAELPELRLLLTGGGLEPLDPLPEGVSRLGVVSTVELASLYRRAACLVFPSLYEGFGLPPLEAMACGCPVAASNAGAIPEVCGTAAVYFDPTSVDAIANGVREALALADELREEGIERASGFSWEKSALRHEEVYRAAAS